jgi:hypothetical protein
MRWCFERNPASGSKDALKSTVAAFFVESCPDPNVGTTVICHFPQKRRAPVTMPLLMTADAEAGERLRRYETICGARRMPSRAADERAGPVDVVPGLSDAVNDDYGKGGSRNPRRYGRSRSAS